MFNDTNRRNSYILMLLILPLHVPVHIMVDTQLHWPS